MRQPSARGKSAACNCARSRRKSEPCDSEFFKTDWNCWSLVERYVDHYNNVRLNSAIGYTTSQDMLAGRRAEIHAQRDRKLEEARAHVQSRGRSGSVPDGPRFARTAAHHFPQTPYLGSVTLRVRRPPVSIGGLKCVKDGASNRIREPPDACSGNRIRNSRLDTPAPVVRIHPLLIGVSFGRREVALQFVRSATWAVTGSVALDAPAFFQGGPHPRCRNRTDPARA